MRVQRLLRLVRRTLRHSWIFVFYRTKFNSSDKLRRGEAFFDHLLVERFSGVEVGFAYTKLASEQWGFSPVVVINELQIYERYQ
ncbi:hypothetical protein ACQ4M3_23500, partial [Leptolyngbya sp. AN03gr2]|uniref:hypothetical protein n=1 Tax=Leptolyngbya sp. AN03gr2 TaxID=3423364 RepID=UPI003D316B85